MQNSKFEQPYHEAFVFSEANKILSEKVLENVLKILSKKYPRNSKYVDDFNLPWTPYFN